ncbi:MAG TPA: D-alanyl-D-alanine carboxypeptidase/D-alanyl-D-alanine-endopeptidase [Burkholderiaceae bacterium]|nr:D-alanyl-D-alanine carboxypeptidase/D-alanyl-D-alanine-endopeptidase [Burkholderiaceae bacterium]
MPIAFLHRLLLVTLAVLLPWAAAAQQGLPPEVLIALRRAEVPPEAMAVVVEEAGTARVRLQERAQRPLNPASLFKLVTTSAGLELLGPAYTWQTPVWLQGELRDGVLDGTVIIKGTGDPKLVLERAWLLLRRVRDLGVQEIRGDIVLDHSTFAAAEGHAGDFDGDALRPYNVLPDALLLNYKSVIYTFTPDPGRGIATLSAEPPLAGMMIDRSVPLASTACDDWRSQLKASLTDPAQVRFAGRYPASCGERSWPVAYADSTSYDRRMLAALWHELGGRLGGTVRDGVAPSGVAPNFTITSPPLAEVVRDINKFSNNVMAQQLFLTLAAERRGTGTPEAGREVLRGWLVDRLGESALAGIVIDNGSGLSRVQRVSAQLLARLLQAIYASPVMPELMSSLPLSGQDGTLLRMQVTQGRAHLKTGSLRDVAGVAGYVLADSGRRYVVVALINHPNANAARPAIDALVQWAITDRPAVQ